LRNIFFYFFIFLTTYSFAQEIHFKEIKYIFALDSEFSKQGSLKIDDKKIQLKYQGDSKSVLFDPESISFITKENKEIFTHEEQQEYTIFFSLVQGVFNNDIKKLQENFTLKIQKEENLLIPNEYLSSIIEKIVYKKDKEKLVYLHIYFLNQDKIKIVQLD